MNAAAVTLDRLTVAYDRRPALRELSGCFQPGSLTAVIGPNGAGKSTLLKAIAGTLTPHAGHIDRGDLRIDALGYLPQAADIERSFPLTVADVVMFGAWQRSGGFVAVRRDDRARAATALGAVGLGGHGGQLIGTLSAGQFQRLLFARLLLQDAPLILLDEPFTAIDARTTADLLRLVADWHRQGRTVIAVLHDLDQVREHFPSTLLVAGRCIAWGDTRQVLTTANLRLARNAAGWAGDAPAGVQA